jgi:hypothetical protein
MLGHEISICDLLHESVSNLILGNYEEGCRPTLSCIEFHLAGVIGRVTRGD